MNTSDISTITDLITSLDQAVKIMTNCVAETDKAVALKLALLAGRYQELIFSCMRIDEEDATILIVNTIADFQAILNQLECAQTSEGLLSESVEPNSFSPLKDTFHDLRDIMHEIPHALSVFYSNFANNPVKLEYSPPAYSFH